MPKRRKVRQPTAQAVRRRLMFDEQSEDSVPGSKLTENGSGLTTDTNHKSDVHITQKTSIYDSCKATNGHVDDSLIAMDHLEEDDSDSANMVYLIYLCCVGFLILSFVPWLSSSLHNFQVQRDENDNYFLSYGQTKILCMLSLLMSSLVAALLGLSCCCFSWVIVYFDSHKPGRIPPTPLSPSKYRRQSGHTFHMNYVISVLNGLGLFLYYLWYNRGSFIL